MDIQSENLSITPPDKLVSPKSPDKSVGQNEQTINIIDNTSGTPRNVLNAIAKVDQTLQQFIDDPNTQNDMFVGGELIAPKSIQPGESAIDTMKKPWLVAIQNVTKKDIPNGEKQQRLGEIVNGALKNGFTREEIISYLDSLGIESISTAQAKATSQNENNPSSSREKGKEIPSTDYQEIGRNFPLDEQKPPTQDMFSPPIATNAFGHNDKPTLAGRVAVNTYDNLVKRPGYTMSETPAQIIERGKINANNFAEYVTALNKKRETSGLPSFATAITRKSETDGFHFNGEQIYSKDHIFYFDKSKTHYKNPKEPEIRAYLTLSQSQRDLVQRHFVDLSNELYDAGIDFRAKAASPKGLESRTDHMVFYISASDQEKAGGILKKYLQDKNIGEGHVQAAISSQQEGLSWGMEPTEKQNKLWQEISGSTEKTSYNLFIAAMAMPEYLDRLAEAHAKLGNTDQATIFQTEAKRVRDIVNEHN